MSTTLAIRKLTDTTIDNNGYDARSAYAELFWLPIIGPTALLLLRHLAEELESSPDGLHIPIAETAQRLGIGNREGKQSPVRRSLDRLVMFNLADHLGGAAYAVRTTLPLIDIHHARVLPIRVQSLLAQWHSPFIETNALTRARTRARRIAAVLMLDGAPPDRIERALAAQGIHPAVAFEAGRWVADQLHPKPEPESEHAA